MDQVGQGDVLRIHGFKMPVVVVSNDYFNRTGNAIVCPVVQKAEEGPLHFDLETEQVKGRILCEQVHYVNLSNRYYSRLAGLEYFSMMDVSDAIMCLIIRLYREV